MIRILRRMMKFFGVYAGKIRLSYIFIFLKSLTVNMPIFLTINLIGESAKKNIALRQIVYIAAAMVLFLVFHSVFKYVSDSMCLSASYMTFAEKRKELGNYLGQLPAEHFNQDNIDRIISVLNTDMALIEKEAAQVISSVLDSIFSQIILLVFMYILNPYVGSVSVIILIIAILAGKFMTDRKTGEPEANRDGLEIAMSVVRSVGISSIFAVCIYLLSLGEISGYSCIGAVILAFKIFTPVRRFYKNDKMLTVIDTALYRIEEIYNIQGFAATGELKETECVDKNTAVEFNNLIFAYESKAKLHNKYLPEEGRYGYINKKLIGAALIILSIFLLLGGMYIPHSMAESWIVLSIKIIGIIMLILGGVIYTILKSEE